MLLQRRQSLWLPSNLFRPGFYFATSEILVEQGGSLYSGNATAGAIKWTQSGGDYALNLDGLASAAGREGAKGDLGSVRAPRYGWRLHVKAGATGPAALAVYSLYWAGSPRATAGTANPALCGGTDAAFPTGGAIANRRQQLQLLGVLPMDTTNNGENERSGVFTPPFRYGMPVVINDTGQSSNSTANSSYVEIWPIIPQAQ